MKYLERTGKNFRWPLKNDTQTLNYKDILCTLEAPPKSVSKTRKDLYYINNEDRINNMFQALML